MEPSSANQEMINPHRTSRSAGAAVDISRLCTWKLPRDAGSALAATLSI